MGEKLIVVKVTNFNETDFRVLYLKNFPAGLSEPLAHIKAKVANIYDNVYDNWELEFDVEEPEHKHFGVYNWTNLA